MSTTTDPARAGIRVVATARYIPSTRFPPETAGHGVGLMTASPREAVMRSVYVDTLRWQREPGTSLPSNLSYPHAPPSAMPERVAMEQQLSLSEMASSVARLAARQASCQTARKPDQVIVCATSFEHDLSLSCAGRLHGELGSTGAPVAVGQLQGASFFLAMQIARDMMAYDDGLQTVLIASAERWLPPFPREVGSLTVLGDGAAAVLLERSTGSGWYLRSLVVRTPSDSGTPDDRLVDRPVLLEVIAETCSDAGLKPSAIDWTVPPRFNAPFVREVSAQAGLPTGRIWYPEPDDIGYLCSADTPAQLDSLLQSVVPAEGRHILLWTSGFQGQAACAILEFHGNA